MLPVAYREYVSDEINYHFTSKLTPATATLEIIVICEEGRTQYEVLECL
jgi:hypothetical protein